MKVHLKVKHMSMILLGVPLLLQLVVGGVLIYTLSSLDRAAKKETTAKLVITLVEDMHIRMARALQAGLVGGYSAKEKFSSFETLVNTKMSDLRTLTNEDRDARTLVSAYQESVLQSLSLIQSIVKCNERVCFTRHTYQSEFVEELSLLIDRGIKCENELFAHYLPVVEEFKPRFVADRRRIRSWITMAITIDAFAVCTLALVYGLSIISRLNLLMGNIRSFSKGEPVLKPIGGKDELAELDNEFRTMAESRDRAQKAQRDLYAMVNHDLGSPLENVNLTLSSILSTEEKQLSNSVLVKLKRMRSVVLLLQKMTESFLDLERSALGKLELRLQSASTRKIVSTSTDAVQGNADSKNVTIVASFCTICEDKTMETSPDDDWIICDPERITQVIVNLLSNAVKYSPRDSRIEISVEIQRGVSCRFEVRDQGRGFTQAQKELLFQRFSQVNPTEDSKIGAGLGLYVCRLVVEAHKGSIGANSLPEGGSVFWVELPQNQVLADDCKKQSEIVE